MPAPSAKSSRNGQRLRAGQKVLVNMGGKKYSATILEDRGDIGVGGRQIVRLQVHDPHGLEDMEPFERPAQELIAD